ncbi:phospholipase A1 member A isoform X1 [Chelonia mydas]|uniref:phospholipase A1 member A isoform X1 n=1 Tax=Chelonia mydas TaxID=8469 RepID=UPI0018A1DF06|nr:phospholipase A1 member A isoform X1 [Chelonia mydas]XP_037765492.1 phospholipase A1 member A isoform X1 [Chelonia mydas]
MGRLSRKKAEDPRKKSVFVLAIVLVLSSACAGHETYVPAQPCSDFQTASFLQGRKLKVQFLLFTSSNPSCGQLISLGDDIKNSNFNTSLDTKIIIHGFRALGTKPSWINGLIGALFRAAKVNVVAVDWVYGATRNYPGAVENVMELSIEISRFISKLLVLGVSRTSVHFIGVSLGAHVAGLVGQFYGGQLGRITGLDPAGPKYTKASREERLDPGDALFVEAIHTDTDNFGIRIPVGHIDYFINGGKDQPGCPRFISSGYNYLICDHMRAVHLYVSALENSCPMMAFPCSSHENFLAGHCLDCFNPFLLSCPRIGLLERGGVSVAKLPEEVKVYLVTASSAPYCMYHSLVEFHLQQRRSLVTNLEITFRSSNSTASVKITIPKQQQLGKGVLAHPVPLCQIKVVMLKYLPKLQIWKKDKAVIVGNFCTTALPVGNREPTHLKARQSWAFVQVHKLEKTQEASPLSDPHTERSEKIFCLSQHLSLTASRPLEHDLVVPCA